MRTAIISAMVLGCVALVGCAADADDEQEQPQEESIETSQDALSCPGLSGLPVGSAAWSAALRACIAGASGTTSGGTTSGTSCSIGVSCYNGVCKCTTGPNTGRSCVGSVTTGSTSCNVMCKVCK